MSKIIPMQDAVLHQNETRNVILIDIPRSLELGQDAVAHLVSSPPPESPYPSTEPKGTRRQKLLDSIPAAELKYHERIRDAISAALASVRKSYRRDKWCLPRVTCPADGGLERDGSMSLLPKGPPQILSPPNASFRSPVDINSVVSNPNTTPVILSVGSIRFHIPPSSVFLCSNIEAGITVFSDSLRLLFPTSITPPLRQKFDLILLDPPWSNRSVRRSKVYSITETQDSSPFGQTLPIIRDHLSHDGIAAVWITNKAAVRQQVLQSLDALGLHLFEEWIWAKVTSRGEPVTALDGIWRRPYEILLLLRKEHAVMSVNHSISRRVIIAVPDKHSRKPCIKILIEPYLPDPYTALELFARSLTSGWWSWGNEVLKFQNKNGWAP